MSDAKQKYVYPSGYVEGEVLRRKDGDRKWNTHIPIPVGAKLLVVAPMGDGYDKCPDAIEVIYESGRGAISIEVVERFR